MALGQKQRTFTQMTARAWADGAAHVVHSQNFTG